MSQPDYGDLVNDQLIDNAAEAWDLILQAYKTLDGFGWYSLAKAQNPNIAYALMQVCKQVETTLKVEEKKVAIK